MRTEVKDAPFNEQSVSMESPLRIIRHQTGSVSETSGIVEPSE